MHNTGGLHCPVHLDSRGPGTVAGWMEAGQMWTSDHLLRRARNIIMFFPLGNGIHSPNPTVSRMKEKSNFIFLLWLPYPEPRFGGGLCILGHLQFLYPCNFPSHCYGTWVFLANQDMYTPGSGLWDPMKPLSVTLLCPQGTAKKPKCKVTLPHTHVFSLSPVQRASSFLPAWPSLSSPHLRNSRSILGFGLQQSTVSTWHWIFINS